MRSLRCAICSLSAWIWLVELAIADTASSRCLRVPVGARRNGDDGRAGLDEQAHLVVLLDGHALFARGTERGEPRIFEFFLFGLREELDVLGIAAGPAAFNVMHAERVELLGDAEFSATEKLTDSRQILFWDLTRYPK